MEPELSETHETNANTVSKNDGWQQVYSKRQRRPKSSLKAVARPNGTFTNGGAKNVYGSLDQQYERRLPEAQRVAKHKKRSDGDEDDDSDLEPSKENAETEEPEKVKQKKEKKPKVTVADAAARIDEADLAAYLADKTDAQMDCFADFFGRAFKEVSGAQFPWVKMIKEYPVSRLADIPIVDISEAVRRRSAEWINRRTVETLGSFILRFLDRLLEAQQNIAKASKKGAQQSQQALSRSQVDIFVALDMVLRQKPDALVSVLPQLRENPKYQRVENLRVIIWMMTQASRSDLTVGLYSWARNLLPLVSSRNSNSLSRDMILPFVEWILAAPRAQTILVNGAVKKGERLIPPSAFEMLLQVTFPASSARLETTERFQAIYPKLKEVALAGSHGSRAMKQVSLQILNFAIKVAGESSPEFSEEAAGLVIWSLTENGDCCRQWAKVYEDNLGASIAVLRKLSEGWNKYSVKLTPPHPLKETVKNFRQQNERAIARESDAAIEAMFKDADQYCKLILGKLTSSYWFLKTMAFIVTAAAVGAAVMSPNMEGLDWKKPSVAFSSQQSF